jgi:hypothetical protein
VDSYQEIEFLEHAEEYLHKNSKNLNQALSDDWAEQLAGWVPEEDCVPAI